MITKKINEALLRQMVSKRVSQILNEYAFAITPSMKELENALDKIDKILEDFINSVPPQQGQEFLRLCGKEWRDLNESLMSIRETVTRFNNQRGISQDDLTYDDLS